jgi:deazaflavin-dependent oxidoreductase (nitroreductase family)
LSAVPLPRSLARFNRKATNKVTLPVAGRLPGFAIVNHRGRRSGRNYRTPVNMFRRPGGFAIPLMYGIESEWTKNVLAADAAELTTRGRSAVVANPRIVRDEGRRHVPRAIRPILRFLDVDAFMLVDERDESSPQHR